MTRHICLIALLLVTTAAAAPVPKVEPDKLPDGALVRLGSARFRGAWTEGVVFSRDGKTLYAPHEEKVYSWNADTGRPLKTIELSAPGAKHSFVRGDRAFVVTQSGPEKRGDRPPLTVHVFTLPDGKKLETFPAGDALRSVTDRFEGEGPSADGRAYISRDASGKSATVVEAQSGKPMASFTLPGTPPGQLAQPFRLHLSSTAALAFRINYGSTSVYEVATEKERFTLSGVVHQLEASPDGKLLAGYRVVESVVEGRKRQESTLTTWDALSGEERKVVSLPGRAWHLQFAGSGVVLVAHHDAEVGTPAGVVVSRWDLTSGKREWTVPVCSHMSAGGWAAAWLAVSPDGKRVAVSNCEQVVTVLDAITGERVDGDPAHGERVRWVGFSADGKTVTTATDRDVRAWDAGTGERLSAAVPPEISRGVFSGATDGLLVWFVRATDGRTGEVFAWDRVKGKVAWQVGCRVPFPLRVLAAGDRVVAVGQPVGDDNGAVAVLGADGKLTHEWKLPARPATFGVLRTDPDVLQFTPTNKVGEAQFHDRLSVTSGERLSRLEVGKDPLGAQGMVVGVTADGKQRLHLTWDGKWAAVDATTGKVQHEGKLNARVIEATALAADWKKLMVAGRGEAAWVTELTTDGKTWALDGKLDATAVAFSPDGKKAVVGYRDGTAMIWDVSK